MTHISPGFSQPDEDFSLILHLLICKLNRNSLISFGNKKLYKRTSHALFLVEYKILNETWNYGEIAEYKRRVQFR